MKGSRWILLVVYGILITLLWAFIPHRENFTPTYHPEDKLPYGCYLFNHALNENHQFIVKDSRLDSTLSTALQKDATLLLVNDQFGPTESEMHDLLDFVNQGGHVILSTSGVNEIVEDSLHLIWAYLESENADKEEMCVYTSQHIPCWNTTMPELNPVYLNTPFYEDSVPEMPAWQMDTLIMWKRGHWPVALNLKIGNGQLTVHTMPGVFSNFSLVRGSKDHVDYLLSTGGKQHLVYDLYFTRRAMLGRPDEELSGSHFQTIQKSPIIEVLKHDLLRYAYYLLLCGVLVYFVMSIKRRQRGIPVWENPVNESTSFIKLIASLYLASGDNAKLLEKKIRMLNVHIQYKYGIRDFDFSKEACIRLCEMTGFDAEKMGRIANAANYARSGKTVSQGYLRAVNHMINEFVYSKK